MNLRRIVPLMVVLLVALFGTRLVSNGPASSTGPSSAPAPSTRTAPWDAPVATPADAPLEQRANTDLVVRDVTVRDMDGRVAWRGDVDLAPVLARIDEGERDPHRNDGGVFGNREGLLPRKPSGYYREYVVRTPGIDHAGPQRVVLGAEGEVFYTSDHYASFRRIR